MDFIILAGIVLALLFNHSNHATYHASYHGMQSIPAH
jgi:hypothetical protein